ncbi:unnamed protein product [Cyprideis torosa]|uniref:Bestrophin homolog n=1 Tax=Cyprideis torosa TaxID=163714 RepID=A0A7R8W9C8_9CRUS|nr:unnamed protein product [Cyprideis torosa]CAG0884727.1 unnamed protein product [Cyprideis torosa]
MTVSYTKDVASTSFLGVFWKLFFRYRGSLFKMIWADYLIFITLYIAISLCYRCLMTIEERQLFEGVAIYMNQYTNAMPVTFVLGFYVNVIYSRWWGQYNTIPWPDNLAVYVTSNIRGMDARSKLLRRTIIRYVNVSYIMCLRRICSRVIKRFPTRNHLVTAGLLEEKERMILDEMEPKRSSKYWVPLTWATHVAYLAYREKKIDSTLAHQNIVKELFFVYMGWLRVAEVMINPFGEDDDDFEMNTIIDRDVQVSYLIGDELHGSHPDLVHDAYWYEGVPQELPHTVASEAIAEPTGPELGSTGSITIPLRLQARSTKRRNHVGSHHRSPSPLRRYLGSTRRWLQRNHWGQRLGNHGDTEHMNPTGIHERYSKNHRTSSMRPTISDPQLAHENMASLVMGDNDGEREYSGPPMVLRSISETSPLTPQLPNGIPKPLEPKEQGNSSREGKINHLLTIEEDSSSETERHDHDEGTEQSAIDTRTDQNEQPKPSTSPAHDRRPLTDQNEQPKPSTSSADDRRPLTDQNEQPKPSTSSADDRRPLTDQNEQPKPSTCDDGSR